MTDVTIEDIALSGTTESVMTFDKTVLNINGFKMRDLEVPYMYAFTISRSDDVYLS